MLNSHVLLQGGKGSTPVHRHDRVHVEVPGVRDKDEGRGRGAAARHDHQAHQLLRGLAAAVCRGTSRGGFSSEILSEVVDVPRARLRPVLLHDLHALCVLCILLSFVRDFNDVLQILVFDGHHSWSLCKIKI